MMNWWKRTFGTDFVETALILFGSFLFVVLIAESFPSDEPGIVAAIACTIAYGIRRHFALKALPPADETSGGYRLADVEGRLSEVEFLHRRVAELEERLDFTERLIATKVDPSRLEGPR
jgi:hypothetical protein